MNGILAAIEKGFISSCHDVSEGGIGVCLSEMTIGGDIGATIDLSKINPAIRTDFKLFSESNTRWIIEVKEEKQNDFEKTLNNEDAPFIKIGTTNGKQLIINNGKTTLINLDIANIRDIWKNAICNIMG